MHRAERYRLPGYSRPLHLPGSVISIYTKIYMTNVLWSSAHHARDLELGGSTPLGAKCPEDGLGRHAQLAPLDDFSMRRAATMVIVRQDIMYL